MASHCTLYPFAQTRNLSNPLVSMLALKRIKFCPLLSISTPITLVQAIIIFLLDQKDIGAWCCPFSSGKAFLIWVGIFPPSPNSSTWRSKPPLSTSRIWHTYWNLFLWGWGETIAVQILLLVCESPLFHWRIIWKPKEYWFSGYILETNRKRVNIRL